MSGAAVRVARRGRSRASPSRSAAAGKRRRRLGGGRLARSRRRKSWNARRPRIGRRRFAGPDPRALPPSRPEPAGQEDGSEPDGHHYERGYRDGLFDGGERLLEERLPADLLIPDVSLEEAVSAGVAALRPRGLPLLGTAEVYGTLERALAHKQPFSLVRLGDGELLTLAQGSVLPAEEVARAGDFLPYAGVNVPDLQARDELAEAVRRASLIGVPLSRRPHFQPLLFAVWRAFGIRPESLTLTTSTINYSLQEQNLLPGLLAGRRVLAVGDVALPLAERLAAQGVAVAGAISPVRGVADIARVVEEASGCDFDLALVSAGIAAVSICVQLAERTGKVALDFGHQANVIAGVKGHLGWRGPENE